MTTLSIRHSVFMKRVFPFVMIAVALAWTFWSKASRGTAVPLWTYSLTAVILVAITIAVLRRGFWSMADTVELSGDALLVRRWKTTGCISLADVSAISWEPYFRGIVVVALELKRSSAFGPTVSFYALIASKDLEVLAARVKALGGEHVA